MAGYTHPANCFCPYCRGDSDDKASLLYPDEPRFDYAPSLPINQDITEENEMLPAGDSSTSTTTRSRSKSGGMTYLTTEMLSLTPKKARILGVKYDDANKFGARVIVKVALDGQTVFWGVTVKRNPNYDLLFKQFGPDENDWVGKDILLFLEKDDFTEKYWPRVDFPDAKAPTRPKGK